MLKRHLNSALIRKDNDSVERSKIEHKFLISSKEIATKNGIGYVESVTDNKIDDNSVINKFYIKDGKYIMFYPFNDGVHTCPIQWYGNFNNHIKIVIDNLSSFKSITNLNEILIHLIELYNKSIDEDFIISFDGLALELTDKIVPKYQGRGKLVFTEWAIVNNKVKYNMFQMAKRYCINDFLDHFISWNFGVVIKNNPELEKAIIKFNKRVIDEKLRKYAGEGINLKFTEDVRFYRLNTDT